MVRFLTELSVTPVGPQRWRLDAPLVCETGYGPVIVPVGFVTDGASVPRPVWWLFPPFDGDYDAAAVLHDYAYRNATALNLTREQADSLLSDGMAATNTSRWKREAIYRAVRLGGGSVFARERKKEEAQTK